jgi:hypothetical protein
MFLSKKCKNSIGTNVIKDVRVPFLGSKENSSMLQHCKAPKIQKHVIFENDSNNNSIFNINGFVKFNLSIWPSVINFIT